MKHILIVDDNKTNLVMAKEALSDIYKITAVTMGIQALKFLENNTCDLILLDINMPEMDGFEVMEKIKEMDRAKDIPIIFLTADNDAAVESRCLEEGAQDFIAKPFVKQVVRSRIGRTLELEDLRASLADRLEKKTQEVIDIKSKSQKDALTGLWNRAYTEKLVDEKMKNGDNGAVFMMDMDNFKAINDNYGHMAGDKTLKMFAETMEKYAMEDDVLCRIGGDEFVMYISDYKTEANLKNRASDMISEMVRKIDECKFDTNTSVSVGISIAPSDGTDFKTLYDAADKALYYVKQNGKNSYHFYSDSKKIDRERSTNLVDLGYLREVMARSDAGKGAYFMDFDSFHHVYNFVRRFVERNKKDVHIVLFTANTPDDRTVENEEMELALNMLEQSIYSSLRKVDISTRYSTKQIIVILLDANRENTENVAKRIIENYEKIYVGKNVKFDFGIAEIDKKIL